MILYHRISYSSVPHPLMCMWWMITPPSEGTMCSMSGYCYDSSHHGYSNHQRSGVHHPLQYSHIYTLPLEALHLLADVSSLLSQSGTPPHRIQTVSFLDRRVPLAYRPHRQPTCIRYYQHEWFGVRDDNQARTCCSLV